MRPWLEDLVTGLCLLAVGVTFAVLILTWWVPS
jgi:hypothetical protein